MLVYFGAGTDFTPLAIILEQLSDFQDVYRIMQNVRRLIFIDIVPAQEILNTEWMLPHRVTDCSYPLKFRFSNQILLEYYHSIDMTKDTYPESLCRLLSHVSVIYHRGFFIPGNDMANRYLSGIKYVIHQPIEDSDTSRYFQEFEKYLLQWRKKGASLIPFAWYADNRKW